LNLILQNSSNHVVTKSQKRDGRNKIENPKITQIGRQNPISLFYNKKRGYYKLKPDFQNQSLDYISRDNLEIRNTLGEEFVKICACLNPHRLNKVGNLFFPLCFLLKYFR